MSIPRFRGRAPSRKAVSFWLPIALLAASAPGAASSPLRVRPGESIQAALDAAAADPDIDRVVLEAGVHRPAEPGQALVTFVARHDGLVLEGEGEAVLTAANPRIADPFAASFPAVVNHVVYFGDGISPRTVLRGVTLTGANNYHADAGDQPTDFDPAIDSIPELSHHLYIHSDGGAIKIFGRSYPTVENVVIRDNFASPCGAGVSVEHRGFDEQAATFRNVIFQGNRARLTGSAVDLLHGSAAVFENCLFVGNISNVAPVPLIDGPRPDFTSVYNREHGSGALTVFEGSRVEVRRSTFTGNWNGVDDRGNGSVFEESIFWDNTLAGGSAPGSRYELDVPPSATVTGCVLGGATPDLRGTVSETLNRFQPLAPDFDDAWVPRAEGYGGVGYRPAAPVEVAGGAQGDRAASPRR